MEALLPHVALALEKWSQLECASKSPTSYSVSQLHVAPRTEGVLSTLSGWKRLTGSDLQVTNYCSIRQEPVTNCVDKR